VGEYENLQATASFKERGALNKLLTSMRRRKKRGVVAMSAGNHAQAVAYHARRLGIPATIVMPSPTPFVKIAATRGFGAEVILEGETWSRRRRKRGRSSRARRDAGSSLRRPAIIAGQGTIALELAAGGRRLSTPSLSLSAAAA